MRSSHHHYIIRSLSFLIRAPVVAVSSRTEDAARIIKIHQHCLRNDGVSMRGEGAEEERRAPSSASVRQLPLCSPENVNGER